jgi:integrase
MWVVHIYKDGARTNRTIGRGREGLAKAIKAAEQIATQLHSGHFVKNFEQIEHSTPVFEDYSRRWHVESSKRWGVYTVDRDEQILRLYIWPSQVFRKPLSEIGRSDIKQFLKDVYRKVSPATVEAVHGVISGVFEEAIDDEFVKANPARGILKKILPPKRMRDEKDAAPFNREELSLFLETAAGICQPHEFMIVKAMAYGGLRLGETLACGCGTLISKSGATSCPRAIGSTGSRSPSSASRGSSTCRHFSWQILSATWCG